MSFKNLFLETRPQFLLLSPILVFLGFSIALYHGNYNGLYFALCLIGLSLLHTSVNTLNDYSDFVTGIDLKSKRTPFSGGSGLLPSGRLKPSAALALGLTSFILAIPIGVYFLLKLGPDILPLFLIGAFFVLLYTTFITRLGFALGEISAGLGLGTLPVIGVYFIMMGNFSYDALYASIPSGFLVFNLLLLNEFPDSEADLEGRRKTLPIVLGHKRAAMIYSTLVLLTYLWIIIGVLIRLMPFWTLLAILTMPIGLKAIRGSLTFKSLEDLIPAQGANVAIVLLIQLFMGIGYTVAYFVK